MTRHTLVAIAVTVALCGCGRGRATQQPQTTTASDSGDAPMTIVGCLVPHGETPENRAVGTSGNPQPPGFTLVNVNTGVKSAVQSFTLVADESRLDDLQRFANSRVEVTGFVVASTGNGTPDAGAASASAGAPPSDVRRLRVTDVRQLESTCGDAKKE